MRWVVGWGVGSKSEMQIQMCSGEEISATWEVGASDSSNQLQPTDLPPE